MIDDDISKLLYVLSVLLYPYDPTRVRGNFRPQSKRKRKIKKFSCGEKGKCIVFKVVIKM